MPLWAFNRLAGPGVCGCVSLWDNSHPFEGYPLAGSTAILCTGGPDVIRKEAWPFYRTISGLRLCWELEEPKGLQVQIGPWVSGHLRRNEPSQLYRAVSNRRIRKLLVNPRWIYPQARRVVLEGGRVVVFRDALYRGSLEIQDTHRLWGGPRLLRPALP